MSEILILGFGTSGRAAAKLAAFRGYSVTVVDEHDTDSLREAASAYHLLAGWTPGTPFPACEFAVLSPGISIFSELVKAVRAAGIPVIGEIEFASRGLPCRIAAVTGTNGKTTTTELAAELFRAAGFRCETAGNIGTALSESALAVADGSRVLDWLVVETSSFQLESVTDYKPAAAVLMNLASDHVNRHGTLQAYFDAKFKLFQHMDSGCAVNANVLDEWKKHFPDAPLPLTFTTEKRSADFRLNGSVIEYHGRPVFDTAHSALPGIHNAENMMGALALLRMGAGEDALFAPAIAAALGAFRPDSHRLECFLEKNGVRYIDDSKATNPHSVNAALKACSVRNGVHLLLGGLDKDMDFSSIAADSSVVKQAYLYGQCAAKIELALKDAFPCVMCRTFEEAVAGACANARAGEIVMLSPACASFDLFKSYADRGNRFKELVSRLAK